MFKDAFDIDIIEKIIDKAKLGVGSMATTKQEKKEFVQYNATDWDFILSRADILGLAVIAHDGNIDVI